MEWQQQIVTLRKGKGWYGYYNFIGDVPLPKVQGMRNAYYKPRKWNSQGPFGVNKQAHDRMNDKFWVLISVKFDCHLVEDESRCGHFFPVRFTNCMLKGLQRRTVCIPCCLCVYKGGMIVGRNVPSWFVQTVYIQEETPFSYVRNYRWMDGIVDDRTRWNSIIVILINIREQAGGFEIARTFFLNPKWIQLEVKRLRLLCIWFLKRHMGWWKAREHE